MNQQDHETSKEQEHVTITSAEMRRLRQLEMEQNLQDKLGVWAQKQFRTALIVVSVVGFLGIQAMGYVLIEQLLGGQIEEAKFQARLLKNAAEQIEKEALLAKTKAFDAFNKTEEQRQKVTEKMVELAMQTSAIDQKLTVLLAKSRAVSDNVRAATSLDVEGLQKQIDVITAALDEYGVADHVPSRILQDQEEIKVAIKHRKQSFQENARYSVNVIYYKSRSEDARLVIERMSASGFEMRDIGSAGLPGSSPMEQNSISLLVERYGKNVVLSPNEQENKYVKSALATNFADWTFTDTVEEQHNSNSTNIVFWGLNIVLL